MYYILVEPQNEMCDLDAFRKAVAVLASDHDFKLHIILDDTRLDDYRAGVKATVAYEAAVTRAKTMQYEKVASLQKQTKKFTNTRFE